MAAAAMAVALSACASTGAVYTPRPFPMPGGGGGVAIPAPAPADPAVAPTTAAPPAVAVVPAPKGDGYALSSAALSLRGAPYRFGGTDPNGFDCSGLVSYVFGQHGLTMPREAREQFKVGKAVPRDRLEPGDLVFFSTVAPGASHVGIAIGGDQFVHAPSERGVVRVDQLSTQYWATRFIGAKRVD
ncbi:MAG: C40 family peptidase [Acidobacteriota bacterium]|nr:C40 family peptidase [Acidobacteriota bacterium]